MGTSWDWSAVFLLSISVTAAAETADEWLKRIEASQQVVRRMIVAPDDIQTEGTWQGQYGRLSWAFCGMSGSWDYTGGSDRDRFPYQAYIGENCDPGDGLRAWVHWPYLPDDVPEGLTDPEMDALRAALNKAAPAGMDPWDWSDVRRVLANPVNGGRRQASWDDHAEAYSPWFTRQGPHLYVNLTFPEGQFLISLYFVNYDAHWGGVNRFRDYTIQVKETQPSFGKPNDAQGKPSRPTGWEKEFDAAPTLAETRVTDFYGGVYKRFFVQGPTKLTVRVHKGDSLNTVMSGIFIDEWIRQNTNLEPQRAQSSQRGPEDHPQIAQIPQIPPGTQNLGSQRGQKVAEGDPQIAQIPQIPPGTQNLGSQRGQKGSDADPQIAQIAQISGGEPASRDRQGEKPGNAEEPTPKAESEVQTLANLYRKVVDLKKNSPAAFLRIAPQLAGDAGTWSAQKPDESASTYFDRLEILAALFDALLEFDARDQLWQHYTDTIAQWSASATPQGFIDRKNEFWARCRRSQSDPLMTRGQVCELHYRYLQTILSLARDPALAEVWNLEEALKQTRRFTNPDRATTHPYLVRAGLVALMEHYQAAAKGEGSPGQVPAPRLPQHAAGEYEHGTTDPQLGSLSDGVRPPALGISFAVLEPRLHRQNSL